MPIGGRSRVGTLAASGIPSGIDAANIGAGTVSNTEFGYLDGVTSAIQSQINNFSAAPFTDTTAITKGSGDATKLFRIENDTYIPTGTTVVGTAPASNTIFPVFTQPVTFTGPTAARTYTLPDSAQTLAGLGVAQTFTQNQAITGTLTVTGGVYRSGSNFDILDASGGTPVARFNGVTGDLQLGGFQLTFGASVAGTPASGLLQSSAGVLKVTDGGSGYGSLIAAGYSMDGVTDPLFALKTSSTVRGYIGLPTTNDHVAVGAVLGDVVIRTEGGVLWFDTTAGAGTPGLKIAGNGTVTASGAFVAASINLGVATVLDVLSATAALDFPSINAGTSGDLTITVTGAVVGDSVQLGRPSAENAALNTEGFVSAADTVTVRAYNNNLVTAVDQASLTYRATVTRI